MIANCWNCSNITSRRLSRESQRNLPKIEVQGVGGDRDGNRRERQIGESILAVKNPT